MANKRNYKRNSKGKGNTGTFRKEEREDRSAESRGNGRQRPSSRGNSTNDPEWYMANPTIVRDAAVVDFNWPAGSVVDLSSVAIPSHSVPGIMAVKVAPTIGGPDTIKDPINMANSRLWQQLRANKSVTGVYEACDLGIYNVAMASIYSYLEFLKRIYRITTLYSDKNKYLPEALLTANGVWAQDIKMHYADLRAYINLMTAKIAVFCVPDNMAYFKRQMFMYQNIYSEGASIKDQLYMYVPAGFYKFVYNVSETSTLLGGLDFVPIEALGSDDSGLLTYEDLVKFGDQLIDGIFFDSDSMAISSDIRNFFGSDKCIKLAFINEYESILPTIDIPVLNQMKHATCIPIDVAGLDIKQTTGNTSAGPVGILTQRIGVMSDPNTDTLYSSQMIGKKLLTFPTPEVTIGDIMVSTRLVACATPLGDGTFSMDRLKCGTEIVTDIIGYKMDSAGSVISSSTRTVVKGTNGMISIPRMVFWNSFKYKPIMWLVSVDASGEFTPDTSGILASLDNYTYVEISQIMKLHEVALFNLFGLGSN